MLTKRIAAAALAGLALLVASAVPAAAKVNSAAPRSSSVHTAAPVPNGAWTTYHRDDGHTGFDNTLGAATGASTGWVSGIMDDNVYAEPLIYNGTVYAATLGNSVYAFDQATGATLWHVTVGAPQTGGWSCGNVSPTGILGTPVIDTVANRIYAVAELAGSTPTYYLFGLDLANNGNIVLQTAITTAGFDWAIQQERGALALSTDRTHVYVPFGGRAGDCGSYHGYVFGVPTNGSTSLNVYQTPNTPGSGIWAAGGVVVDDSTGKVIVTTGNGGCPSVNDNFNDSILRLTTSLALDDYFFPPDWSANWSCNDQDLGSASPVLISPTLAFQAGKWGNGFLVNPQSLGGMQGELYPTPKPQAYSAVDVCVGNHIDANFGSYAYAAPFVYLSCEGNGLVALSVNTSTPSFSSCDATCGPPTWRASGFSPGPPIVAAGAAWAVDTGGGGLYGFNAANGIQIYHSGNFGVTHFTTPAEAGGQIFVGSGTVVRSFDITINSCKTVTGSAMPASPQLPGTPVTISGSASGCPNPLYEFWRLAPGSNTWTMAQAYSISTTYNWNTTGAAAGTYHWSVWARDAASSGSTCGSLGCYDSFAPGFAYTLSSTACASVTASAMPASPQAVGTPVNINASAMGCSNPRYEFWILAPGGSWTIKQAYSPTATFAWTTTGLPAGTYYYSVWVRDSTSSAGYDAYFPGTAYMLTFTPCTSPSASAMPASPQSAGTPVTITASSSGCPNPRYEFWILAPGGSWTIMQAYSSTASFTWTTIPPAGTYRYSVWVRDAASPASYDTYFPGTAYVLTTTPCTSATASATPGSPQTSGTPITITASASGCSNPRYEFWILAPGGSWSIVQTYSSSNTFNWTTTGLPAGTYHYSVWVRDASSGATYDTYFPGTPYTLS